MTASSARAAAVVTDGVSKGTGVWMETSDSIGAGGTPSDSAMDSFLFGEESEEGGPPRIVLKGHTAAVGVLAVSPDGCLLVSGSDDGEILVRTITPHSLRAPGLQLFL